MFVEDNKERQGSASTTSSARQPRRSSSKRDNSSSVSGSCCSSMDWSRTRKGGDSVSDEEDSMSLLVPYLFKLVKFSKWDEIRKCLNNPDKSPRPTRSLLKSLSSSLSSSSSSSPSGLGAYELCQQRDETNLTCLGLAMAYNAPLDIIELMVKIDPSLALQCDDYGATALHVGCLNGTSFENVDFIMGKYKGLAKELDIDRRSPLHHAIEYTCTCVAPSTDDTTSRSSEDEEEPRVSPLSYVRVLKKLCTAAPNMVHVLDKDKTSPIDLLQRKKFVNKVCSQQYKELDKIYYEVLRKTSIYVYKRQKTRWEEKGRRAQEESTDVERQRRKLELLNKMNPSVASLSSGESGRSSISDQTPTLSHGGKHVNHSTDKNLLSEQVHRTTGGDEDIEMG